MSNDPSRPTRVAAYARVSTADQDAQNQIAALREHAERAGWTIVGEYVDHAVSGTREKRPGLDRMMADARRRHFETVVVVALDRLGRSLHHLIGLLAELEHLGVRLMSLREAVDFASPLGRAMYGMIAILAEIERSWIAERTRAGLRRARAQGKKLGRPRVIGDPVRVHRLLANGSSHRAVARILGVSPGAVRRVAEENGIRRLAPP